MHRTLTLLALLATSSLRAQTITEYRWWTNDDISTMVTTAVAPTEDALVSTTLDLPALSRDYSIVTFQFKDSNNEWSIPTTLSFTRSSGDATGYEYWIDDAIADSHTGSLGPNGTVDLIADLPTGVPAGTHVFTIRFSSTHGSWSVPLTTQFNSFTSIAELPGITDLLLFPNPVNDQLGLRLSSNGTATLNLQVLDLSGALVRDLHNWSVNGTGHRNWDISDLAGGSYLLRISSADGTWATPFVKQ